MRHGKVLLISILSLFSLIGCTGNSSNSINSNLDDVSSIVSSEEPIVEITDVEEFSSGGSYGGYFTDINFNRILKSDASYAVTFQSSNSNKEIRVTSSREESVTISRKENSNSEFDIVTHKPGDSIVCIYDADDMLVYRKIVRVRKAQTPESIVEECFQNDTYLGMKALGDHKISFVETNPFTGVFTGSDDYESGMEMTFTASYEGYVEYGDFYSFKLDIIERDPTSTTIITYLYISTTADIMMLYYGSEGYLLNQLVASTYKHLYNGYV